MLHHLINLLYPNQCLSCGDNLCQGEHLICTQCLLHLPFSLDYNDRENDLCRQFYGRFEYLMCSSLFFYTKTGIVQHLIHQLKYNRKSEVGVFLGEIFGNKLSQTNWSKSVDAIVPVPLHPKRLKFRGYNQAEQISIGISNSTGIAIDSCSLSRNLFTGTQTKKDKDMRWENVRDVFEVRDTRDLRGKHILLVDDVITTGSTIEGCVRALQQIPDIRISVGCLATPKI
jgi:ComF family protein